MNEPQFLTAEDVARAFHETYEQLAPDHGYETRPDSAVAWPDVPESNRSLMVATVESLMHRGVIYGGRHAST